MNKKTLVLQKNKKMNFRGDSLWWLLRWDAVPCSKKAPYIESSMHFTPTVLHLVTTTFVWKLT